jgi:hypothetical protein
MFPNNWLDTLLVLLLVVAGAAWLRYLRGRNQPVEDEVIDYSTSGTEPGHAKAKPLPKEFGTAKNHPHHQP